MSTPQHAKTTPNFWVDATERIGMQAAYAAITEVAVVLPDSHISQAYVPLIMLGLNGLKIAITKAINGTASAAKPAPVAQTQPIVDSPAPSGS